jgi:hypothetical protein
VLRDVSDPQPVRIVESEVAVDEVARCWRVVLHSTPSRAWQALQACSTHQHLHGVVAHGDPMPEGQLGVNPTSPVGATRRDVDLGDRVGQPGVAQRTFRRWPSSGHLVARHAHVQDATGDLDRVLFRGDHSDRREPPFGSTASFNNSFARRVTASSASSSAIRLRAATSST